ncbi:hus1-like protein [Cystoisospora suis]|uniref:Hus1-like protein n=1 Tax=Cystoisospora suis TaxID=483139 RepID=A0A2C6JYJ7_9APIC|nr:hus1-like protein [Cystoisospora suis]
MRRLKTDDVVVNVVPIPTEEGLCELTLTGASDLVNIKTTFPKCALLVADRNAKHPAHPRVCRYFKTRRLALALKVAQDMSFGRGTEGLVACVIPEDEQLHPWACVVFHSSKQDSLKLFCVLPTTHQPRSDLI